eukprot:1566765-Prymnesium_polylepis.1
MSNNMYMYMSTWSVPLVRSAMQRGAPGSIRGGAGRNSSSHSPVRPTVRKSIQNNVIPTATHCSLRQDAICTHFQRFTQPVPSVEGA